MSRYDRIPRAGSDRANLYDEITSKIIAELEAGRVPWVQPWGTSAAKAPLGLPKNASTGRSYSGINILLLWGAVVQHGFPGQGWLTFRQALSLGGNVRKGERGTTVVYADRFVPEDERKRARETGEEAQAIPFLKRFSDSTLHMVTGLLLPIWKRLPNESSRVYRLQTDAGERIIGRKVSPAWAANATTTGATALTPEDVFMALMDGRTILDLSEGLQLRRVRVMAANRIELSGFTDTMRERLTAYGLFHEIISWKLRMFVPVDANGPVVLTRLLDRWPVERIGEREAA